MSKTHTSTTPLRMTLRTVSIQVYSLVAWLLVVTGGMVAVGSFFLDLSTMELVSGAIVGLITLVFGLGMARLLNRDIKQTAPVLWF